MDRHLEKETQVHTTGEITIKEEQGVTPMTALGMLLHSYTVFFYRLQKESSGSRGRTFYKTFVPSIFAAHTLQK